MTAACVKTDAWQARLELQYEQQAGKTVLARRAHNGPLLVQRPFYPENHVCHSYIIHPPGGVVGGDELQIDIQVKADAHALLTTPASGKFYNSHAHTAQMTQNLNVESAAILEWLPQDNIFFEGSRSRLKTQVNLQDDARFIGWEISCLGRPLSGKLFTQGQCDQQIHLLRNGLPVLVEHGIFNAEHPILTSNWGLGGFSVSGTLLATTDDKTLVENLRSCFDHSSEFKLTVTVINDILVCRFLGSQGETARKVFEQAWQLIRPVVTGNTACSPRIWKT